MSEKSVIEAKLKKAIASQKEYSFEYTRVAETINNRIAERIARNPDYDPWDAPRRVIEIMREMEYLTKLIKKYKKDLEDLS